MAWGHLEEGDVNDLSVEHVTKYNTQLTNGLWTVWKVWGTAVAWMG